MISFAIYDKGNDRKEIVETEPVKLPLDISKIAD
jgi:hypothetical protein